MTGPEITDEDVEDVAEWLHPIWFESDHGRGQTYGDLLRAVRGALESRAGAMHDRWAVGERERIAAQVEAHSCCGAPSLCGATCQDSEEAEIVARGAKLIASLIRSFSSPPHGPGPDPARIGGMR